jgi:hypothetical protein
MDITKGLGICQEGIIVGSEILAVEINRRNWLIPIRRKTSLVET